MFTRRIEETHQNTLTRFDNLNTLLNTDVSKEVWLFACPHDDDIAIGAGMWFAAAARAGAEVHLLAATDGRMGYCAPEEKEGIVEARYAELVASCKLLGLEDTSHIHVLGFPDCDLGNFLGRRPRLAVETDAEGGTGYTGLQGAFVKALRTIRPDRLLLPSPKDYHPDHQQVYNEMMISIFHADGGVWPELGAPTKVPDVYEMAIYCDFPVAPTLQYKDTSGEDFNAKLAAIAAYQSQKQIGQLVEKVRQGGPIEYLREVHFDFYDPNTYHGLFED